MEPSSEAGRMYRENCGQASDTHVGAVAKQEPPMEVGGSAGRVSVGLLIGGISSQGRATVRGDDIVDC